MIRRRLLEVVLVRQNRLRLGKQGLHLQRDHLQNLHPSEHLIRQ